MHASALLQAALMQEESQKSTWASCVGQSKTNSDEWVARVVRDKSGALSMSHVRWRGPSLAALMLNSATSFCLFSSCESKAQGSQVVGQRASSRSKRATTCRLLDLNLFVSWQSWQRLADKEWMILAAKSYQAQSWNSAINLAGRLYMGCYGVQKIWILGLGFRVHRGVHRVDGTGPLGVEERHIGFLAVRDLQVCKGFWAIGLLEGDMGLMGYVWGQ